MPTKPCENCRREFYVTPYQKRKRLCMRCEILSKESPVIKEARKTCPGCQVCSGKCPVHDRKAR